MKECEVNLKMIMTETLENNGKDSLLIVSSEEADQVHFLVKCCL